MLIASRIRNRDGAALVQEGCIWVVLGLLVRMIPSVFFGATARVVGYNASKDVGLANTISQAAFIVLVVIGAAFALAGLAKLRA